MKKMTLHYQIVPVTAFEQNCSVLWCDETLEAAVVDPGGDLPKIRAVLSQRGLSLKQILLTHAHIDHAGGTAELSKAEGVPIIGPHLEDDFWIQMLPQQAQMFGFPHAEGFKPDQWLNEGDQVRVGNCTLSVLHCPGHTPGHVVFFSKESQLAIVGDVLFQGSIGRTDFPKGDFDTLAASIRTKLWPLGDQVSFVPGHGPMSTIGHEKATNPFVGGYG
jgi:glyoxylase-like metal-dependent hydrolase (beta-lactamase superfamily II)